MRTSLLALGLAIGMSTAQARTNAPKCDFKSLSRDCKMFSPDKEFITLPDGSQVPNFSFQGQDKWGEMQQARDSERFVKDGEKGLERKFELAQLLSTTKVSGRGTMVLADNPGLFRVFADVERGKIPAKELETEVRIYWPLDSEGGTVRMIKLSEVYSFYRQSFTPTERERITKLTKESEAPAEAHPIYRDMNARTISESEQVQMIDQAKASIEKAILNGRGESSLSVAEKAALKKLRAVTLDPKAGGSCGGLVPNAFYSPSTHKIAICRGFEKWPRMALMTIIGHELGHAVDPCFCQHGLYELDGAKLRAIRADDQQDPGTRSLAAELTPSDAGNLMTGLSMWMSGRHDIPETKALMEAGAIRTLVPASTYASYPFRALVDCLAKPESGGFRSSTAAAVKKMIATGLAKKALTQEDARRLRAHYGEHPECLPVAQQKSQMGEATADWFGARVAADELRRRDRPPKGDERLAPFLFVANIQCMNQQRRDEEPSLASDLDKLAQLAGEHPISVERVDKILLRDPELARLLGCQPRGPACSLYGRAAPATVPRDEEGVR